MESSAVSDSEHRDDRPILPLPPEQLVEIRASLETNDLSRLEEQIGWLVDQAEVPTSLALGMRLAVAMASELRDKVSLGSRSGKLVAEWIADYPETTEEAIAVARQFLLRPAALTEELSGRLFAGSAGEQENQEEQEKGHE